VIPAEMKVRPNVLTRLSMCLRDALKHPRQVLQFFKIENPMRFDEIQVLLLYNIEHVNEVFDTLPLNLSEFLEHNKLY
jgi:hypothetical protein